MQATGDPFEGLTESLKNDWLVWRQWIDCKDPMGTPVPCGYEERVNSFQRIMVLKAFREEKCLEAMRNYVREEMGARYVEAQAVVMADVYADMSKTSPLVFVLSQGDPTDKLRKFGRVYVPGWWTPRVTRTWGKHIN